MILKTNFIIILIPIINYLGDSFSNQVFNSSDVNILLSGNQLPTFNHI